MSRDGGGSHSGQISRVKQANQMPIEINFMTAIGHRFESQQLAHKSAPNETLSPLPFDMTAIAHPPHFPAPRIFYSL